MLDPCLSLSRVYYSVASEQAISIIIENENKHKKIIERNKSYTDGEPAETQARV